MNRRLVAMALILVATFGLSACGRGRQDTAPFRSAFGRLHGSTSFAFIIKTDASRFYLQGVADPATHRLTETLIHPDGHSVGTSPSAFLDGKTLYVRASLIPRTWAVVPKGWVAFDLSSDQQQLTSLVNTLRQTLGDQNLGFITDANLTGFVDDPTQMTNVSRIKREGTTTTASGSLTHYSAIVDNRKMFGAFFAKELGASRGSALLAQIPAQFLDIWIDRDSFLRELRVRMDKMWLDARFSEYGGTIRWPEVPAGQVAPASSLS